MSTPRSVLLALVLMLAAPPALARPFESEFQVWNLNFVQGPIAQPFVYYLEAQPRIGQGNSRVLLRSAVGVVPVKGLSLWLGYAWIPVWTYGADPAVGVNEGRLFEQLQYTGAAGPLKYLSRTRLEHRLLASAPGTSHRLRTLLRGAWGLDPEHHFYALAWDEVFFHLNSLPGGPTAGFDQNRAFVGMGWRATEHLSLELGYLNVYTRRASAPTDLMYHAAMVATALSFL